MEKKQTAVDWFFEVLQENYYITTWDKEHNKELQLYIERAKEIEKEQLINFTSDYFHFGHNDFTIEEFYTLYYGKI